MQIAPASVPTNTLAPAPQSTPIRGIRSLFEKTPWLRSLQIGDHTAGELMDKQLQFGITRRAGAGNGYVLIPHTTAALRYLHSDAGTRLNGIVDAMLGTSSLRGAKYQVQGISLATDRPDYVLNTLFDSLEWGDQFIAAAFQAALADPAKVPEFVARANAGIAYFMTQTEGNFEQWLNLAERYSAPLLAIAGGTPASSIDPKEATELALVLGHELEHSITPPLARDYSDEMGNRTTAGWIEEGGTELLNVAFGNDRHVSQALGLTWDQSARRPMYSEYVESMTRLFALAGIDVSTRAGAERANAILQRGSSGGSPDRIVRAIAEHRDLARTTRTELRHRLDGVGGDPAKVADIERWLAALPAHA